MSKRRQARELALQCLHQWDQQGPDSGLDAATEFIERIGSDPEVRLYCGRLLDAFWNHSIPIDEKITTCAANWRLDRMAVVDRNVLRLAVTELLYFEDIPPKVVIDEAIEIAKKYSTERSGSFVNGILDRVHSERSDTNGPR